MDILVKIIQFFLCFTILIGIHELGHFVMARVFKIRVEKFYIFFDLGFSLFKFRRGDTEYGLGWLPLGGYCKIAGMIDESMDTEQMKQPAKPDEFRTKPAWQRFLVMIAGVVMNVVLAVTIYIGICYTWGDTSRTPTPNGAITSTRPGTNSDSTTGTVSSRSTAKRWTISTRSSMP